MREAMTSNHQCGAISCKNCKNNTMLRHLQYQLYAAVVVILFMGCVAIIIKWSI